MADSKLLAVCCIVLMPFPPAASLASIPCLYVLYWIYVERENFQHKRNVESAISYNTFWLELMKDLSEQPDKTCYIVFIIINRLKRERD